MKELNLLLIIAREKDRAAYEKYFSRHALASYTTLPCRGTAQNKVLDLLGIEQTEKTIFLSVIGKQQTKDVLNTLPDQMEIDLPGRGIGLVIPVNSMGGVRSMQALTGSTDAEEREVVKMEYNAHLIIAILNKGFSDVAMEAARAAGAGGGTVVHAKGTAAANAEKFFGMSLAEEKELIFIVTTGKQKKEIMRAIMDKAGVNSDAHALVFSLPVAATAGFRLLDADEADVRNVDIQQMKDYAVLNPSLMVVENADLAKDALMTNKFPCPILFLGKSRRDFTVRAEGFDFIEKQEKLLRDRAIEGLKKLEHVEIYNEDNEASTIAFNIKNVFAQDAASYFAKYNICLRAGQHCAKLIDGVIDTYASVRCSFYFYNTIEEVDKFIEVASKGSDFLDAYF